MEVKDIPIKDIIPPDHSLRQWADEEKLEELMESIRQHGLINPITVVREGDKYRILAGYRRYIAVRRLGWDKIPAHIVEAGEGQDIAITLAENLKREDINPLDLGYYFRYLVEVRGMTQREIAEMVGHTPAWVSQLIGLTRLPQELQDAVREEKISFMSALKLGQIEDDEARAYFLDIAIRHGASTPVISRWVEEYKVYREAQKAVQEASSRQEAVQKIVEMPEWRCTFCGRREGEVILDKIWVCRECTDLFKRALEYEKEQG